MRLVSAVVFVMRGSLSKDIADADHSRMAMRILSHCGISSQWFHLGNGQTTRLALGLQSCCQAWIVRNFSAWLLQKGHS
eukprot:591982-Amphidinium_carterae.1